MAAHRTLLSSASRTLCRGLLLLAGVLVLGMCFPQRAQAQSSGDFSLMFVNDASRFVGNQPNTFFYLRGASAEIAYAPWKGIGFVAGGTGTAGTNLRGAIDIHTVTFFVGPRYTYNIGHISPTAWNRKGSVYVQGKVGYTLATSGQYPVKGVLASNDSSMDLEAGGGINFHIYHRFDLRLVEADLVHTSLPNGASNTQNSLRVATGINFHIGY
jgi:hypothetical protein